MESSRLHPRELAYLGDAVFELFVREQLLQVPLSAKDRHRKAVARVRAAAQAAALESIAGMLSEQERDLVRRTRNLKLSVPRGVDPSIYAQATALEALVGFWYVNGQQDRLLEILAIACQAEGAS
ncbi:MAG: Mini-ribonuclease 3 [Cyanobacteria bacterium REEB65]|nr:Mini-ribonuclease 3 [Cyanobacteria bacterium REEB65]